MNLLEIGPDLLSLEFRAGEMPAIRQQLDRLGRVSVTHHATHDVLSVAGEDFIYESEWDEPCLIARSAAGSALLRFVAAGDQPVRLAG